ncbi:hypothetical protein [Corallococcus exiguus]|uniref:hypothetical protein n=1 Tax=Corallococcus exiguus TaxID=83462 RepID=UPI00155F7DC3|nr:hypothetical protein [Corallococcus exiguus]NRD59718.1 hypothetical protein [Corallococcus exiguus]
MKPLKTLDDYLSVFCLNCTEPKAFHDFSANSGKCPFSPADWDPCTESGLQQLPETARRTIAMDLAPEIRADWSDSLRANPADTRAFYDHYAELLRRLRECSGMTSL